MKERSARTVLVFDRLDLMIGACRIAADLVFADEFADVIKFALGEQRTFLSEICWITRISVSKLLTMLDCIG